MIFLSHLACPVILAKVALMGGWYCFYNNFDLENIFLSADQVGEWWGLANLKMWFVACRIQGEVNALWQIGQNTIGWAQHLSLIPYTVKKIGPWLEQFKQIGTNLRFLDPI